MKASSAIACCIITLKGADNPFGAGLGQAGLARFERDVLAQTGISHVIVGLGINDILFPAPVHSSK